LFLACGIFFLLISRFTDSELTRKIKKDYNKKIVVEKNEKSCQPIADIVVLIIVDNVGWREFCDRNISNILSNPYIQLFRLETGGVPLTKTAIKRMISGFQPSMLDSMDNNNEKLTEFDGRDSIIEILFDQGKKMTQLGSMIYKYAFDKRKGLERFHWCHQSVNSYESVEQFVDWPDFDKNVLRTIHFEYTDKLFHIYDDKSVKIEKERDRVFEIIDRTIEHLNTMNKKIMTMVVSDHGFLAENHGSSTEVENTGFALFVPNNFLRESGLSMIRSKVIKKMNQVDIASILSHFLNLDLPRFSRGISIEHNFGQKDDRCFRKKLRKHLDILLELKGNSKNFGKKNDYNTLISMSKTIQKEKNFLFSLFYNQCHILCAYLLSTYQRMSQNRNYKL